MAGHYSLRHCSTLSRLFFSLIWLSARCARCDFAESPARSAAPDYSPAPTAHAMSPTGARRRRGFSMPGLTRIIAESQCRPRDGGGYKSAAPISLANTERHPIIDSQGRSHFSMACLPSLAAPPLSPRCAGISQSDGRAFMVAASRCLQPSRYRPGGAMLMLSRATAPAARGLAWRCR